MGLNVQRYNQNKTYEQYEKFTEKMIEKNMMKTIQKVQKEYRSDVFGFGEEMYRQDYRNFKRFKIIGMSFLAMPSLMSM